MPETLTALPLPTFLSENSAEVSLSVKVSPATMLLESVTPATRLPSYTLLIPAAPTVKEACVMLAVVVAVLFCRL